MNRIYKILLLQIASIAIIKYSVAQVMPDFNPAEPFSKYSKKMDEYYAVKGKNAPGYKQWKRQQWYQEARLGPDGKIVNEVQLKQDAIQQTSARALGQRMNDENLYMASWSQLGPTVVTGNGIGRINRITFHPTNASIFYVSTAGGGLWKTVNGGSSWQSLTDGLPNINTSGVAIDYTNTNVLYLLTGDADAFIGNVWSTDYTKRSMGVLKSSDGGNTWNPTGLSFDEISGPLAYNIRIHPTNPAILYVSTTDGIYRTTNSGTTWTLVLPNHTIYDMEFKPGSSTIMYASGRDSIFRTLNSGVTWSGVYKIPTLILEETGRCELAVTPDDPEYVYALAGPGFNFQYYRFRGLFRSVNGGDSFTKIRDSMNILGRHVTGQDAADQSRYDLSIAVDPLDKNHIITGGIYQWQSFDGGTTIARMSPTNNYHADIHDIKFHPLAPSVLYHCSDGGVYQYFAGTNTWNNFNNGLPITEYYRISTAETNAIQVTGGSQDNGSHMRKIASSGFDGILGADGMDNIIAPSNSNYIYASIQNSVVFKSTNNGSSFTQILDADAENLGDRWVTPLALHPTDNNTIFIGTHPIVRVFEAGGIVTIDHLNNTASANNILKIASSDANLLYAANSKSLFNSDIEGTRIWRTSDGGNNWNEIYATEQKFISDMALNPDNPNEIWATFGGFESGYKVLKSSDGGANWTNVSGSLPNVPVNCIIYKDNNGNPDDALYIGTDIGVFYRDNNLGDWIPFSTGLPVVVVTDLEIQASSGLLRAGTYGRGIWETSLFTTACNATYTFTTSSHDRSTPYFYQASSSIISTAQIVGTGSRVQYRAGSYITLNPGFAVNSESGAKFTGLIGSCISGGVPPGYFTRSFNGLKGFLIK
jgi:photosystem II stability/assembly factor-like uncharacterized protein